MSRFEEITESEFATRKESGRPPSREMTLFARLGCVSCPKAAFFKSEDAVSLERMAVGRVADLVQVSSVTMHDVLTATQNYTCDRNENACPNEVGLDIAREMLLELK